MTTNQTISKPDLLEEFLTKGARKGELYNFYKPHSLSVVRNEILDILIEDRNISIEDAKRVWTLKGSEVKKLENRLG